MKTETITCESGKQYEWTPVPRFVHWRHGRIAGTFHARFTEITESSGDEVSATERGLRMLESLSDQEAEKLMIYVDDVLKHGLKREDVSDIRENDYWELFGRSVFAVKSQKIETTEGSTTVEAVENFSEESEVSGLREDVPNVLAERVEPHGVEIIAAG